MEIMLPSMEPYAYLLSSIVVPESTQDRYLQANIVLL
jgi:hypothetical protein